MGNSRPANQILAFATAALVSGIAAPRVQAQESDWLEVQGSTTLTLRNGESTSYQIRLKKVPPKLDRDGNFVDQNGGLTDTPIPTPSDDPWWILVRADGVVRDGEYDVDGDPNTGYDDPATPEREGYDLTWVPSLGREFHGGNWNEWVGISIRAHSDIDDPVVFSHEVWSNNTYCPEHGVAPVTVTVSDQGEPGVRVSPTALTLDEGRSGTYDVVLLSKPTGNVRISVSGQSGDVTVNPRSLTFTTETWTVPQTVTVDAGEDPDADADDAVTLTHSASGGGYNGVTIDDVVVTIEENDEPSTAVNLSIDPDSVREGGGRQRVTVTGELDGAVRGEATTTVTLTVEDGTADSFDYSAQGATLTIPKGRTSGSASVYITPVNDMADEADETVNIEATSSFTVSPSSIPVTIVDNYGPPTGIDLTVFPNLVGEDEGEQSLRVTATLTGGGTLTTPTDVTLSVVGITATVDDDYTYTFPPTLTIPANSEDGTEDFFLTPVDNDQDEPDKTLEVQGTSLPGASRGPRHDHYRRRRGRRG